MSNPFLCLLLVLASQSLQLYQGLRVAGSYAEEKLTGRFYYTGHKN